jgi:type IV secretory pathway ATPase VirB11/archaellum biosynthesis ATPase
MKTETEKATLLLQSSFLAPLLIDTSITDISFNGESIYYQSSVIGRQKSDIEVTFEQAFQLLKQLANLMNHSFSYAQPILDISVGAYRIHAVGEKRSSITPIVRRIETYGAPENTWESLAKGSYGHES